MAFTLAPGSLCLRCASPTAAGQGQSKWVCNHREADEEGGSQGHAKDRRQS